MKLITLDAFLGLFSNPTIEKQTFPTFLKKAHVKLGSHMIPLQEYVKKKSIPLSDVKVFFENLHNKDGYLARFYHLSMEVLPERIHFGSIETPMKNRQFNNNAQSVYKNVIRNLHFKDILQKTESGLENVPTFLNVLFDLFLRNIIDYKLLTPSALFYTKAGRLGSVFSSFYFRASIMSPFLVWSLNKQVLKGTRIFTPTLGWSSYCYGFLECQEVVEYVGTDVIPAVCEKTRVLAKAFSPTVELDIYCSPSEDLLENQGFMKKYKGHFDVVFFSPPYYRLEMYSGKTQSTERYKTYEDWLANYWEKTVRLCHHVLQKGGRMCYILSDYGPQDSLEHYNLVEDMNAIAKRSFRLKNKQTMLNKNVNSTKHRETGEQIMIFLKP
jgi:hypothetical protein